MTAFGINIAFIRLLREIGCDHAAKRADSWRRDFAEWSVSNSAANLTGETLLEKLQTPEGVHLHSPAKKDLIIAGDDPTVLMVLREFFYDRGYEVRTASNGFEALAEIQAKVPDILLSDLNMPGMSGVVLIGVVKRRFRAVRLIAMSGAFSAQEMARGIAAHSIYQKGTDSAALLSAVESA